MKQATNTAAKSAVVLTLTFTANYCERFEMGLFVGF